MNPQSISLESLPCIVCPACHAGLEPAGAASLRCRGCGRHYPIVDGIPVLMVERAIPGAG